MIATLVCLLAAQGPIVPRLAIQRGVSASNTRLAFSPDGSLLLVGSPRDERRHGAVVQVWDLRSMRQVRQIGNLQNVDPLMFSPQGDTVLFDGSAWNTATWTRQRHLPSASDEAAFSPDGTNVALNDGIFDGKDFVRLVPFEGFVLGMLDYKVGGDFGTSRRFTKDGTMFYVTAEKQLIGIESTNGKASVNVPVPESVVGAVEPLSDGRRALVATQRREGAATEDGPLYELDLKTHHLTPHRLGIGTLKHVTPLPSDRSALVLGEWRQSPIREGSWESLHVVDLQTWKTESFADIDAPVERFALSPDGRTVCLTTNKGNTEIWDVATRQRVQRLPKLDAAVKSLAVDATGKRVSAAYGDGAVRVWDVVQWRPSKEYRGLGGAYRLPGMAFGTQGTLSLIDEEGDVCVFDPSDSGTLPVKRLGLGGGESKYTDRVVAVSPSGRYQVVCDWNHRHYRVLDLKAVKAIGELSLEAYSVDAVVFDSDDPCPLVLTKRLREAGLGYQTTFSRWEAKGLRTLGESEGWVRAIAARNGQIFVCSDVTVAGANFSFSDERRLVGFGVVPWKLLGTTTLPADATLGSVSGIEAVGKGDRCVLTLHAVDGKGGGAYRWSPGSPGRLLWPSKGFVSPPAFSPRGGFALILPEGGLAVYDSDGKIARRAFPKLRDNGRLRAELSASENLYGVVDAGNWVILDLSKGTGHSGHVPSDLHDVEKLRFVDGKSFTLLGHARSRTFALDGFDSLAVDGQDFDPKTFEVRQDSSLAATVERLEGLEVTFPEGIKRPRPLWRARVWNLQSGTVAYERLFDVPFDDLDYGGSVQAWRYLPSVDALLTLGYDKNYKGHTAIVPLEGKPIVDTPIDEKVVFYNGELEGALNVFGVKRGNAFPILVAAQSKDGKSISIDLPGHDGELTCEALDWPHTTLATGSKDNTVILWDLKARTRLRTFVGHEDEITAVAFAPDGKRLYSASLDGTIKVWDVATGTTLATLVAPGQGEFVVQAGGYHMASRGAARSIGFRVGERAYPFDQFDLRLNRPDKVLEALGADTAAVSTMREAVAKRLRRAGTTIEATEKASTLPEVAFRTPPERTDKATVKIEASASHPEQGIARVYAFVNDVPAAFKWNGAASQGSFGLGPAQSTNRIEGTLEVELAPGPNKVQLMVETASGARSIRETAYVVRDAPIRKPALYLVTVGVSHYRDGRFDLQYADKDAEALASGLGKDNGAFRETHVLTLTNEKATVEALRGVRAFIAGAAVDDVVVLFVAGHGMLDRNLEYYFGTHDVNFDDPAKGGLSYRDLEGLLDGISAQRKLLMMDTCHAGEVDPDARKTPPVSAGVVVRGLRATPATAPIGITDSFRLMLDLFADPGVGSGAAVLSASGGAEYALEQGGHGVFTSAILDALKNKEADLDKDGTLSLSELQSYVIRQVDVATNGAQRPTSRRETWEFDLPIWRRR